MPIVGIARAPRDPRRDDGRDGLEHEREAARRLQRARVLDQALRLLRRPALRPETAQRGRRLRCQADVPHHRDAGRHDGHHAAQHRTGALELDRVGARLLDEADRVLDRGLVRDLERAERHVRHDERPPRAACDRAREHDHLVHRGRHGRVVSEDGHRGRVADEHDVGAGLVGQAARRRVVRGHHHDRLAPCLQLDELGDRQLARRGSTRGGCSRPGAHAFSSSGTLSIRRVDPTRTAAARTGGWKGAIAT